MDTDRFTDYSQTSCDSTGSMTIWLYHESVPRCHHDGHHSIRRIHAKGSNGYLRREHGKCVYCDRPYTRTIRWTTKDARSWWEPLDDSDAA